MNKPAIQKGDLVRVLTLTRLDKALQKKGIEFLATVLECRHRTNAYLVYLPNGPYSPVPYWISGDNLVTIKKK